MADVVVVDGASTPVVVVEGGPVDVVVVDQTPAVTTGVVVQSPPLARLAVDAQLLGPGPTAFVELVGLDLTITTGSRIRARTSICAKATSGTSDGNVTALLTPDGDATQQGLNASCWRSGSTSPQSAATENEWTGLSPGLYRVSLAWRVASGAGIECGPVTTPNSESAVLAVEVLT